MPPPKLVVGRPWFGELTMYAEHGGSAPTTLVKILDLRGRAPNTHPTPPLPR
jgi:hypothetical protein